jgi:hypothetical protein
MTDKELAGHLGIEERLIGKVDPKMRKAYERMIWAAGELNAGRRPPGVMVCKEHKRK